MRELIIEILAEKIDKKIVTDLVDSYASVKDSHIKGDDEEALSKSGKFVENVFRVLKFIKSNVILNEIKSGQLIKISEELKNTDSSKIQESIRLLIPKIAMSIIYETRSKSGAVHVKEINPDFIDGKLTVSACDWIMAELLRTFHSRDPNTVSDLIGKIVKESAPIIQVVGEEKFVTANLDCKTEILVRLSDSENGLTRKELGKAMKLHFSPQNITQNISKLLSGRQVFLTDSGRYIIADPVRIKIKNLIADLAKKES